VERVACLFEAMLKEQVLYESLSFKESVNDASEWKKRFDGPV